MAYKLLLADDSVTIQRVIELTFADEDVKVISVGDGGQAMDRIPHERPDIVLADAGMPQHDGYEVARFIKSEPSLAHIPVLLLTGAFEPVDEARARAAGCDGVLAKPFEPQMLIARVKELLARGRSGMPSVSEGPAVPSRAPVAAASLPAAPVVPRTPIPEPGRIADVPTPAPPTAGAPDLSLDEYFDKLDAAFANLSATLPSMQESARELGDREDGSPRAGTPVPARASAEPAHLDVNLSSWMQPRSATPVTQDEPAPRVSDGARTGALDKQSDIGDAFAALLASEQGEPLPSSAGGTITPLVSEAFLEEVTRRVLTRLSDRVLRDAVADVVSRVAERVVREEIERLKASLR
jgi:CheY-like chemotaxis protein